MNMFYRMKDGYIISSSELENSFYHTHGYRRFKHNSEYLRFLYDLLGTVIVEAVREYDMQVDDLAAVRPVLAVRLYQDRYHCSVREAFEYIHRNDDKRGKEVRNNA